MKAERLKRLENTLRQGMNLLRGVTAELKIIREEESYKELEEESYVVINGLKWDKENTVLEDRERFNFYEAIGIAQANGKRLPTQQEWEYLVGLGITWDKDKKGVWLGKDSELKENSTESIFLPAAGIRNNNNATVTNTGTSGYYWSSTVNTSNDHSYYLYFNSTNVLPAGNYSRALGMSVRCVAE